MPRKELYVLSPPVSAQGMGPGVLLVNTPNKNTLLLLYYPKMYLCHKIIIFSIV